MLTVTDNLGASSQCTGVVTVIDTTPPTIACPANMTVESADPGGTAVAFSPTVADNCTATPSVVCAPSSGATFPLGMTTVTCTAMDASQNSAACAFTVNARGPCDGAEILPDDGGMVTDARSRAMIEIPPHTLKSAVRVKIFSVDSPASPCPLDTRCGVSVRPGEILPDVPGFRRATGVIRFEADPCRTIMFGPSGRIKLNLLASLFPNGLPVGRSLRLFELARFGERLVFLDTGIAARVTGPGQSPSMGDFVMAPDIPVFSTFAVFMPVAGREPSATIASQLANQRLYFPVIHQSHGRQTRISIANADASMPLNVTFTAFDEVGHMMGEQSRVVVANRQASFPISALFPNFAVGAIVATGHGGAMTGFYEIADNFSSPTTLSGADGIQMSRPALIFPIVQVSPENFTDLRVFNPNASPVSVSCAGFTSAGDRVDPVNASGQVVASFLLPAFGTLVMSSSDTSSVYDVRLPFNRLDGGCVVVQTTDGQGLTGGEIFGTMMGAQQMLGVVNSMTFPSGCFSLPDDGFGCHVDESPEAPVPSATRQHTMYAVNVENHPAEPIVYLINIGDRPAQLAFTAFSDVGQFRAASPPSGFRTIGPRQVFQASLLSLFGFNPSPGYVRVEDADSSFVGCIINRASGRYVTALPLMPDEPPLAQMATTTFFSRVQLDPASASPRQLTGLTIFNPSNNSVQFTITLTDAGGTTRQSPAQPVAARGVFTRARQSLSVLFPGVTTSTGFMRVQVTTAPRPGQGGRIMPITIYRANQVVSTVPQQNKQP
jgi:hypothetical protein